MPGRDRIIDPITRDYVSDGKGGRKTASDGRTKVYHQLTAEKNGWWGDPDSGSDLHKLARAKNSEAALARARDMTRAALEPLEEAGIIEDVHVIVERDQAGRLVVVSASRAVQSATEGPDILAILG